MAVWDSPRPLSVMSSRSKALTVDISRLALRHRLFIKTTYSMAFFENSRFFLSTIVSVACRATAMAFAWL